MHLYGRVFGQETTATAPEIHSLFVVVDSIDFRTFLDRFERILVIS